MGYIVGTGGFPSTWLSMRSIATASVPPLPYPQPPNPSVGSHNLEWAAYPGYLKTIEGNGFLRIATPATSTAIFDFYPNDPPADDFFLAYPFPDPYPELLVGRTVTTTGSSFSITADAFTSAQNAGTGGENPISVEWFEALT